MTDYPDDLQQALADAIVAALQESDEPVPDTVVVTNSIFGAAAIDLTQAQGQ